VVRDDAHVRAIDKISLLAATPTDLVSFWRSCTEVISTVVPHYWTPCYFTLDPASLLITSHFHDGLDELPAEMLTQEYGGDDVHKLSDIVRSAAGVSTLHEATGGNPSASPRWRFNMSMGGDQEMIARLRTRHGEDWGAVGLYREPGAPMFCERDKKFVCAIGPHLAAGAQRSMTIGEATDPEVPDAPGLLVIDDSWQIRSAQPDGTITPSVNRGPGRRKSRTSLAEATRRPGVAEPSRVIPVTVTGVN
jgi:hypothetical protein